MDRVTIETPERVALEYELAGLGSRFAALLVDGLIQTALGALLLGGLVLLGALSCDPVLGAMDRHSRGEPDAFAALAAGRVLLVGGGALVGLQVAYHTLFEGLRDGQTPGKRLLGIRVVQEGGLRLQPAAALVRNLVRPLDFLPVCFGLGAGLALLTARGQRLGDLAAHTLVVRERAAATPVAPPPLDAPAAALAGPAAALAGAVLTADEAALVRGFLDRRDGFDAPARARLAGRLAAGLQRRHGDLGRPGLGPEGYLERLAGEKRA